MISLSSSIAARIPKQGSKSFVYALAFWNGLNYDFFLQNKQTTVILRGFLAKIAIVSFLCYISGTWWTCTRGAGAYQRFFKLKLPLLSMRRQNASETCLYKSPRMTFVLYDASRRCDERWRDHLVLVQCLKKVSFSLNPVFTYVPGRQDPLIDSQVCYHYQSRNWNNRPSMFFQFGFGLIW